MQLRGGRIKLIIDIPDTIYEGCKRRCAERKSTMAEFYIAKGVPYEERPQGEWIEHNSYFYKCSKCQKIVGFDYIEQEGEMFNFCPNCGAGMRWEKHSEAKNETN